MKSLYTKIVGLVCLVLLGSALIALLISNLLYYTILQASYSKKVEEAVQTSFAYYEQHGDQQIDSFYEMLSATGFQLYVVSDTGEIERYGNPFRDETIAPDIVEMVRDGQVYQGMREYPFHLFLLGLFDNEVINTYGAALQTDTGTDAVFIRPDLSRQIRELHLFVGAFLGLLVLISFLLLVFSIRYLVRPIKRLTKATQQMTTGDYSVAVATTGQDEIGELSRRFDEMAQAVAKSDAERKTFVANVSHEFQSPLTTIKGYAGQLEQTVQPDDRAKLVTIGQEATRMAELTRQLLVLARLDEGRQLTRSPMELGHAIQSTLQTLSYQLDEQGVAVALDVPDGTRILANELALDHIFHNIIRNALHVSTDGQLISIQAETTGKTVTVRIRDEGPGMTPDMIEHAFERFYQGDAARGAAGTGLGLAIVQETIHQLGGEVFIESTLGIGTTFVLTFPRAE
ncbi:MULTISPECIES: HAMP domain-containing sensor histidine kinase [Exiguobacterium]|uniref:HAMP domain-containing sensor histidine kinase n=1 Tax=Exiguobacterium TaxID=33986 RepID=UPI00047CA9CB|nr:MULTISPECIES: HAMP domain-containing sensor histidine kinase [Exiguobacterium]MCT4780329.1 HAMP domain-containing histidine kinase [Exiguobacterium soli]